ncbi:MAG: MFS transporter, partial [Thermoplasmata archaeon]
MTGTALALLTCTALLVSFSESMLIPALPTIQAQFGSNAADISWVPAIYLLVGAISVPLFGKLGDLYGKKRMLTFVMLAYSIAVILDGFAWNLPSLLVFRAVQGLGLAMFPLAISLIHDEAVAARVPVAVGLITSMNGVGAAIGLIGGAYITQTFSWQTNYNLLAPFAVVLTLLLYLVARESTQLTRERIDYVGLSIFGLTITMLLLAISEGGILGWTSTATITLFALSAIFAVALVVAERHVTNPLFEIHLPEVGSILKVDFAMLVAGAVMFMGFYMVIYFAQEPTIGL